jgi:hypothetical protein
MRGWPPDMRRATEARLWLSCTSHPNVNPLTLKPATTPNVALTTEGKFRRFMPTL